MWCTIWSSAQLTLVDFNDSSHGATTRTELWLKFVSVGNTAPELRKEESSHQVFLRRLVNTLYLWGSAPRGGVGNCPRSLLSCAELGLLKDLDQYWKDVGVNDVLTKTEKCGQQQRTAALHLATTNGDAAAEYLNLSSVSCGDVGHSPAGLLLDGFLRAAEKVEQTRQCWAVQDYLRRKQRSQRS